ncbi:MAG: penicillin-binding protein 2, partial [Clostridia bacterium]|nr:penicillin-binding protein 2 [Clostridia bacterium]
MKRKRTNPLRYVFLCALVIGVALVYIARLINLQFVSADNYKYVSDYTYTRTEKIKAQRGEIYDRNGVPLVTNEYYYNVLLDYG